MSMRRNLWGTGGGGGWVCEWGGGGGCVCVREHEEQPEDWNKKKDEGSCFYLCATQQRDGWIRLRAERQIEVCVAVIFVVIGHAAGGVHGGGILGATWIRRGVRCEVRGGVKRKM